MKVNIQHLFPAKAGIFLFATGFRLTLRPIQPPVWWLQGFFPFSVGKVPQREVNHFLSSCAEVKTAWIYAWTLTQSSWRGA